MKVARSLLVALALVGCDTTIAIPRSDSGPHDAGPPMGDGALPDAWTGTDGGTLEDAGADSSLEDAATPSPDAWTGADAGPVSMADACGRVRDAWELTGCNPDAYWCGFAADAPSASVEACESAIATAYADLSGDGSMNTRCMRAWSVMNRCGS